MNSVISNEIVNTEREKANILCLIKLTLNTLIDQSSSPTALPVLDDRDADVTNFILTIERVLSFRMRANWLSERRYFWDFVRPACIGSSRQSIIERVEEVSKTKSIKEKGRTWIKFALMEKKLSELLKLVISDCHLVRKFYHDDSIMTSSHAFILCDQLAGLAAIDFSFCFKQDGSTFVPLSLNHSEIDVIDLTPFLCYKSKYLKQLLRDQNSDEENQQPSTMLSDMNELKPLNSPEREMISLDKHKLEVEQRKYFEELLRHRDRELQQFKSRFETLKSERENEVVLMENIILELQLELRVARDEAELKRKKSQQSGSTTPTKGLFHLSSRKNHSPTTPTNDPIEDDDDDDTQMRPVEGTVVTDNADMSNMYAERSNPRPSHDFVYPPSQSSRRSSHSTTTTNTDDDQYELVRHLTSNLTSDQNATAAEMKATSSPEMVSSATSLSSPSLSSDEDEPHDPASSTTKKSNKPVIHESGRFEPIEITAEQANLLEEASTIE